MTVHRGLKIFLTALFFAVFFWNAYLSLTVLYDHNTGIRIYADLRNDVVGEISASEPFYVSNAQSKAADPQTLPDINETALIQINPEYAAWILIPDTKINYPVVYPKDNTTYLTQTFNAKKQSCGCLFFDAYNPPFSKKNTIIHGHNMKAGDMFGGLKQYLSKNYADAHSELFLYKDGVWSCCRLSFIAVINEEDLLSYASDLSKKEDGKLLTLSTCYGKTKKMIVQWIISESTS